MANPATEGRLFGGQGVIRFHREVDRRNFLKYAGLVGVGSSLVLMGACDVDDEDPEATPSPEEAGADVGILNYALTLEFLEAQFYERGLAGDILSGRERDLVTLIGAHELAHVSSLSQTILEMGGSPIEKPSFEFPDGTFMERAAFLETASTFEELGVTAYHGQITNIQSPEILAAAAAIAGVESRHAAIVAKIIDAEPFPAPVEATRTMDEVLEIAQPFISSQN